MVMGKVIGHVVSTRKNEAIVGSKILEIQLIENGSQTDKFLVAIDTVGAGIGEYVLVTQGSSARLALVNPNTPVDAVVVGADRIAANGDVANKIGTYGLAVLARRHGVPFYVAAPASTVDKALSEGSQIPIEERDPAEVLPHPIAGVEVWNPSFDVTPAALIARIVTEDGAFAPGDLP